MSNSGYAQKRVLKLLLALPYDAERTWHFRKVGAIGVTPEKMLNEEDYRQLTAKDRAGKSWLTPVGVLQNIAGNVQLYRADLDRNGAQDLVIWRGVSGDGLTPSSFLILITFNQQGHPCVFQVDSFYTANETGADDLLGLQSNDHTQLLDMQFGSGYWVASLHQVKEAKRQCVHDWFGRLSYLTLTRFIYTPSRKLVIKPVARCNSQTKDLALTQCCLTKGDMLGGVDQN